MNHNSNTNTAVLPERTAQMNLRQWPDCHISRERGKRVLSVPWGTLQGPGARLFAFMHAILHMYLRKLYFNHWKRENLAAHDLSVPFEVKNTEVLNVFSSMLLANLNIHNIDIHEGKALSHLAERSVRHEKFYRFITQTTTAQQTHSTK